MRRFVLLLLGVVSVTWPGAARAQDGERRLLRCTSPGAEAPGWYSEPPKPPADAYQAEARSGGCSDAETAQRVAARLASWLLVYQKSPRAVLEEIELRRRATAQGGAWNRLQREFAVVERAVARKVLTRSWVHRQETRWTGKGRVEHFLVVRADTTALREAAAEELTEYFENPDAYLAEGRKDFSARDLRWVSLTDSRGAQRIVMSTESHGRASRSQAGVSLPPPPPLKRVVLSWRTDPTLEGSTPLSDRPQQGRLGINLSQSESPWRLAVSGKFERHRNRELPVAGRRRGLRITDARELSAYGLLAVPHQLVPVYAGYRSRKHTVHPFDGATELERAGRALILGLGVPPFAELAEGTLRNAYLEMGMWPKLISLDAGTRIRMARLPGASMNGVLGVSLGFFKLGDAEALGMASLFPRGAVYRDSFCTEAGLELSVGDAVGAFALWEYETSELAFLPKADEDEYDLLFRATRSLSEETERSSLSVGLRLSL